MRHGLIDRAVLQGMLYDALDESDDIVLVLEQTDGATGDLTVVSANEAFCRATGSSHADLNHRPLRSLMASTVDLSRCLEVEQAAHERRSCRSELLLKRGGDESFWFGLHLMPVSHTEPPCFIILGRDITESLLARHQQAAIQGLLAKVFLVVKAPVAIVSAAGSIQMTNPALDDLLGYAPGALVGKRSIDFVAPAARPAALAARQRQLDGGPDYTLESHLLHADGSEVPVTMTANHVERDDLRRVRILTILRRSAESAQTKIHVAGKIRLIGLDDVKEALGPRWAAAAARAMASAEHVIRRRCGPRDTLTRTRDGGFLICFADATEEEAAFRAAALAREIRARLIGEGESEAASDVSAIAAAVEVPNAPGQSPDMLAAAISDRLNSRMAGIEARARETLREAVKITTCRLEPVRSRRTRDIIAQFAKLPSQEEQRLLAAWSTLPTKERQSFDFDRLVLGVAADQAITEIAGGGSLLVMVDVDCEVFLDRRRTERYVAACQALDIRLRERLVLVLRGIPKGFPKSRVQDCLMRLRPFCHALGIQSNSADAQSMELSSLGASIVVLQEDRLAQPAAETDKLARMVDSLHRHQARVLVRHLASWEDALPLVRIGIDLLSITGDERDATAVH